MGPDKEQNPPTQEEFDAFIERLTERGSIMEQVDYSRFNRMRIQRNKLLIAATALINHLLDCDKYWERLKKVVKEVEEEADQEEETLPQPRLL